MSVNVLTYSETAASLSGNLFEDSKKKILLVEDAESILIAISDYLSDYFHVTPVENAADAEAELAAGIEREEPFDLLVTDIRLPDKSGFDLVRYVKKESPLTKVAVITSYEINDFIDFIYEEGIDQVITKHSFISLHDIYVMAKKLTSGNIFGIDKYFEDTRIFFPSEMKNVFVPKNKEIYSVTVKSSEEKVYWINRVSEILENAKGMSPAVSRLVLDELLTNAIVRAPRYEDGDYKYQTKAPDNDILIPKENIVLDPEDYVILQFGFYDDWTIIACRDPHGGLSKKEILYRLHRHISTNPSSELPLGISDSHGRGIFLMREHLTYLIYNIQKNHKTEALAFFNTKHDIPYKNISIYETE